MPILIALGLLIGLAGLASLLHLGSPGNAWRAILHLRKSWLSREVLTFLLFSASWLASLAMPGMAKLPLALSGMGLVYSMAQVYRLRSIPAWDSNRTLLAFALSAILLGGCGLLIMDPWTSAGFLERLPLVLIVGLGFTLWNALPGRDRAHQTARSFRLGLLGLAMLGMLILSIGPDPAGGWIAVPIFMLVLIEEGLGRWLFYEHLHERDL